MRSEFVLLGTGTPNLEAGRAQSAAALIVAGWPYLIDCGGGVVQRIADHDDLPAWPRWTRLFLTHLHPDHTAGLPDFLIAPWVEGRVDPVTVVGPAQSQALVTGILTAYEAGIAEHRDGLAPIGGQPRAQVHPVGAEGLVYQDERLLVEAIRMQHGTLTAFAYKFTTFEGRVIVVSGDGGPSEALAARATGCDLLVHEVYSAAKLAGRDAAWQAYHRAVHTSSTQLAQLATVARPKTLLLTHQLLWGASPDDLLAEVRAGYEGDVRYGVDGLRVAL